MKQGITGWLLVFVVGIVTLFLGGAWESSAQVGSIDKSPGKRHKIEQGRVTGDIDLGDSIVVRLTAADSLKADTMKITIAEYRELRILEVQDSVKVARKELDRVKQAADSAFQDSVRLASMKRRERRKYENEIEDRDPSFVRHSKLFRNPLPLSQMTAISFFAPGFGQIHNKQAWKLPILYGGVGAFAYMWSVEQKSFKSYKKEYDYMILTKDVYGWTRKEIDPIQKKMIQHNTYRQLFMVGAIGTYLYFVADGVLNHPDKALTVKRATTLSMFIPGAGQIYNQSYWKVPIVLGGFASLIYIIDWNNRGYQRFDKAYKAVTSEFGTSEFYHNGVERYSAEQLKNYRSMYRRNRDLSIILTAAFYALNIIDAHADAHMKSYDISDDLTFDVTPTVETISTTRGGSDNMFGLSLGIYF